MFVIYNKSQDLIKIYPFHLKYFSIWKVGLSNEIQGQIISDPEQYDAFVTWLSYNKSASETWDLEQWNMQNCK
jgi:hypothetical protein